MDSSKVHVAGIKDLQRIYSLGFEKCESDYCVFVKKDPVILIRVYVNDLVLITENSLQMQQLKSDLIKEFK